MQPDQRLRVKRDTRSFKRGAIVLFKHCTDSGRCYLVADPADDLNREWIMDYDLEVPKTKRQRREEERAQETADMVSHLIKLQFGRTANPAAQQ